MWEECDSTQCLGFVFTLLWEKCLLVNNRSCFTYIQKPICFPLCSSLCPCDQSPGSQCSDWHFTESLLGPLLRWHCRVLPAVLQTSEQWEAWWRASRYRRLRPKAKTLVPTVKNSLFQSASGPCCSNQFTFSGYSVCHQNVIYATAAPASSFVTLSLPGLSCCQLHQDPSQEQRQDHGSSWDSRSGKEGQWMQSGSNRSISFPEGQTLQQTHIHRIQCKARYF